MNLKNAYERLTNFLSTQTEWLLIDSSGKSFPLRRNEIEITPRRGRLLLAFLDDRGFQTWRITAYEQKKGESVLDLTRNFEKDRRRIRFVPRISAEELGAEVELARLEKANQLAALIIREINHTKLIRVALNKENGRFARIIFGHKGRLVAALADVSATATPELLLSGAIRWLDELRKRRPKNPISQIRILAEPKLAGKLHRLHALLRPDWQGRIGVWEIKRKKEKGKRQNSEESLSEKKTLRFGDLWRRRPTLLKLVERTELSQTAREIIALAPNRIDHIFTKNGETLRFFGLPFARVRKMIEGERSWFGVGPERRVLSEASRDEFEKLIGDLRNYRRFDTDYRRHEFYRSAPEAWLESILRRNIKLLDANLILSPLYNQFRASAGRIDLLALRRDGRLVIIELKVAPDREMIFQAIDYWQKIELQRRKGVLNRAKLFGNLPITDKPAIVYLVAPTLSYHRDFGLLAKTISEKIEIYRFELAENWRECAKVLRRRKL